MIRSLKKHWLRNLLVVTGILGVTYAQIVPFCDAELKVKKNEKKHITKEICVTGDVIIDDDADWKNEKKLIMGNPNKPQRLKPPKGKSMGDLVIGMSPADVTLDGDLIADSLTIEPSARLDANGYDVQVGFLTVRGDIDLSKPNSTGRNMKVTRDIHFTGTSNVVLDNEPLVLAGTGYKMTIVTPATYSGSDILTATGFTYKFHSLLKVDQKSRTVIEPAIYSGSTLLQATGSHLEWYLPSLGYIIIE